MALYKASILISIKIAKISHSLVSVAIDLVKRGKEEALRATSLIKKDVFALGFIILLTSSLIIIKGISTDNHTSILGRVFKQYIEEAPLSSIFSTSVQSAEFSQVGVFVGLEAQTNHLDSINTVQQSALLAFNSIENDFSGIAGAKSNQIFNYAIQEGDTLSFIASDFGVTMNTIIWANNLNNIDNLRPGDELKIPPINGIIHTVKGGDTIASIAKRYEAEEEKIIEFNALPKNGSIQISHELVIPDGKITMARGSRSTVKSIAIKRFSYLPDLGDFFMIPANGRNWGHIHGRNGVDIATSCGTPIFAAASGIAAVVDAVGWNGGFGKYVKLVHSNGTETLYAHNGKVLINQGERVERGQQIALVGTTGRSTGCHLHFEVHGARNPLVRPRL